MIIALGINVLILSSGMFIGNKSNKEKVHYTEKKAVIWRWVIIVNVVGTGIFFFITDRQAYWIFGMNP